MKEELNTKRVALSLAAVSFILSAVCLLLIAVAPTATTSIFGSIFHGIDISKIAVPISWGSAILGVIVATLLGSIVGWLFAKIYNKLN